MPEGGFMCHSRSRIWIGWSFFSVLLNQAAPLLWRPCIALLTNDIIASIAHYVMPLHVQIPLCHEYIICMKDPQQTWADVPQEQTFVCLHWIEMLIGDSWVVGQINLSKMLKIPHINSENRWSFDLISHFKANPTGHTMLPHLWM